MSTTADRLRVARAASGITQVELARRSGVSERTIRRLETSVGPLVAATTLGRIARVLDISFTSLVEDTTFEQEAAWALERGRLGVA